MKLPSHIKFDWPRPGAASASLHSATRTLVERTLTRRDDSGATSTCKPGNNSAVCQKPISSTSSQTLPIILGAVIPICIAVAVIFYLHRRVRRKQRAEDANDPHRSWDFGTDVPGAPSNKSKGGKGAVPEMTVTDLSAHPDLNHHRGLSLDMIGSPYMLPHGLQGSRESLHSMSRSIQDEHDPYRPVTMSRPSAESSRTGRTRPENGSLYSASTNENANLVSHARPMSQSYPPRDASRSTNPADDMVPLHQTQSNTMAAASGRKNSASHPDTVGLAATTSDSVPPVPPVKDLPPPSVVNETSQAAPPQRTSSASPSRRKSSVYGDEVTPPVPEPAGNAHPAPPNINEPAEDEYDIDPSAIYTGRFSIDNSAPSQQLPGAAVAPADNRMSMMGLRPLPPEVSEENAEQRANRIRSFYREYFDDSKPNPANGQYDDAFDYYDSDLMDGAVYDPETGSYFYAADRPFAQPPGRRAMTPPAGGARFAGAHGRAFSTMSGGGRGPRRPGPPAQPKKKLPPPKPLHSLPTPHLLKEDQLMSPVEFAPRTTFRDAQNGRRPDSPMGIQRPFSPNVRVFSPLVPAADDLSVMPSPHHLRKSGTFTSLEFARLPRFRGQEGGSGPNSDSGSIRSARSGISAMQLDAVRSGAYRVSRIPKEMVTTRNDLVSQLRPEMNMIRPA